MAGPQVLLGILVLGAVTLAFKLLGPLAAGRIRLPAPMARAAELLPTALIAGLVVTQTFEGGTIDARVLGVLAAVVAVTLRAPFAVVVVVGAGTAALLRSFGVA